MDPFLILLVGIVVVVGGILWLRLHAFLALVAGAFIVAALTPSDAIVQHALDKGMSQEAAYELSEQTIGERVANKFGGTCAKIGILIAMASIVGKCLLESGSADRIVRSTLKLLGEPKAPLAFMSSGFVLGIPVFFDTVFYLLIPLGKAMGMRTGRNYLFFVLCIVGGAAIAHSLVPPTPGPLFVASALNVDLGLMILGGMVVGIITCIPAYFFAMWASKKWPLPVRGSEDVSLEELEKLAQRDESQLPPLWLALIPIFLPVVLIAGKTVLSAIFNKVSGGELAGWQGGLLGLFDTLGNPNIALAIAAAIALGTLARQQHTDRDKLAATVQSALAGGGLIILITAGGGAFGGVLQQTGIGSSIKDLSDAYQIGILPLAFGVTALVRAAQGSGTVSMITSVGIMAGMATSPEQLGFHPLYLALAIGCGSKPFPWMNDSGFWVVCKMSGMTEIETLRSHSVLLTLMGFTGIIVVMILARIYPMV